MEWNTVAETIVKDDHSKWDRKVSAKELRVSETGALKVLNGHVESLEFPLSDTAMTQMCQKLEIPVKYYRRLSDEMKSTVANFDIGRLNGNSYLLRGKGDWIRAFLSADYVAYNNTQIAETAEALLRNGALSVKAFVLEETQMFLKIISEGFLDPSSNFTLRLCTIQNARICEIYCLLSVIDLDIIRRYFPDLPIIGFFTYAEIGPTAEGQCLHNYTGVLTLVGE